MEGPSSTSNTSPNINQNKRFIRDLPRSYYVYEWMDYTAYACLSGVLFGVSKGLRAMRKVNITTEKIDVLRTKIYKKPALSETVTMNEASAKRARPLEKKHIITAGALQNGVRYGVNSALFVSTFCAVDGFLRSNTVFNDNSLLKKINEPLNRSLIPDEIFNRMTVPTTNTNEFPGEEQQQQEDALSTANEMNNDQQTSPNSPALLRFDQRFLTSHNVVHKMIAGTVSGTCLGALAGLSVSGGVLGMILYGSMIGLGIGTCASPVLIPIQNLFTYHQLKRYMKKQVPVIEKEEEKEAIETGVIEHSMRDMVSDESIFLNELDRVKSKLDLVIAETEELRNQQNRREEANDGSTRQVSDDK